MILEYLGYFFKGLGILLLMFPIAFYCLVGHSPYEDMTIPENKALKIYLHYWPRVFFFAFIATIIVLCIIVLGKEGLNF